MACFARSYLCVYALLGEWTLNHKGVHQSPSLDIPPHRPSHNGASLRAPLNPTITQCHDLLSSGVVSLTYGDLFQPDLPPWSKTNHAAPGYTALSSLPRAKHRASCSTLGLCFTLSATAPHVASHLLTTRNLMHSAACTLCSHTSCSMPPVFYTFPSALPMPSWLFLHIPHPWLLWFIATVSEHFLLVVSLLRCAPLSQQVLIRKTPAMIYIYSECS